jgi:hypothetical protein
MSRLTHEQLGHRIKELIKEEASEQESYWWLSFCNIELPEGTQFLGACIVPAQGILSATAVARMLGCNPGGEVAAIGPIPLNTPIPNKYLGRLLNREECGILDRIMMAQDPSTN